MTKEKILQAITQAENESGGEFDLTYDEQTECLFDYLTQTLDLRLSVKTRSDASGSDYWLQAEYYSDKLQKTIVWKYEVGNFDDYDEVTDYIIRTEKEIAELEAQLPDLSSVSYD